MPKATIMLAQSKAKKNIDPEAVYHVSEKLDGVPVLIKYAEDDLTLTATSRQGKPILSIDHILKQLHEHACLGSTDELVGELWIKDTPFKDIGGLVRKQETNDNTRKIQLYIFPEFANTIDAEIYFDDCDRMPNIHFITGERIQGKNILEHFEGDKWLPFSQFYDYMEGDMINKPSSPYFEGFIARRIGTYWEAGKRSNDFLKLIGDPTLDLKVTQVFPAWKPKVGDDVQDFYERVGSFECMWGNGETCKVGAGKLTHKEAEDLWQYKEDQIGRIIEVKYKRDPSYSVPRQPTFQHFRDDKDEYDLEMV